MFFYILLALTIVSSETIIKNQTNEEVELNCPITSDTVTWSRNNKTLGDSGGYKLEKNVLHFTMNKNTLGEYFCHTPLDGSREIHVETPPIMEGEAEQYKNAINDETFVFECKGFGNPRPVVTWMKGNQTLLIDNVEDESPRITVKNSTEMDNALLKIKRVQYEDGGEYFCVAYNKIGNGSTKLNVSIKDKYAALWPFLGICVEVAVLCGIILFIEKRRAKKEEKVLLVEDHKSTTDNKATDDLRQRK